MMMVFDECSRGVYQRSAAVGATDNGGEGKLGMLQLELKDGVPVGRGQVEEVEDGTIILEEV